MNLRYLPGSGAEPFDPRRGYRVLQSRPVGGVVVVHGQLTWEGRDVDQFVAVYRPDGSITGGARTVPSHAHERAAELFDRFVAERRAAA